LVLVKFFLSMAPGLAAAFGWLVLSGAILRLCGITTVAWTKKARVAYREQAVRMGQATYILVFGVLEYGVTMGLATTIAGGWPTTTAAAMARFSVTFSHEGAIRLVLWMLCGCLYGFISWAGLFPRPNPNPPMFVDRPGDQDRKS
jgi:hypothetical protein